MAATNGNATLKNIFGAIPGTTKGKAVHIGGDPKGKNFVYATGNGIFIRNLQDPLQCDLYNEHISLTTVARYAPSGFYIASGDASGKVRIWDTTQKEHILKIELPILSGPISDIQWSEDSKRIVVVGEGKEKFGAVVMFDSGSSVGEISGHTKAINSCDFKQTRPYRIATGSEDGQVGWFEGPPFKFKSSFKEHTKFVNCVRFSPDGNKLVTVSSDKMGYFYDAKEGKLLTKFNTTSGHTASIFSVCWSPDSKMVATASVDKTVKIWDAESGNCTKTLVVSSNPTNDHQQYGVLWQGSDLISVGANGDVYYWDLQHPESPKKVLYGHNKSITALAFDHLNNRLLSAAYDGNIVSWDLSSGWTSIFKGKGHTNQVNRMVVVDDRLVSCAKDDAVRTTSLKAQEYNVSAGTDSCPTDVAASKKKDTAYAVTVDAVCVISGGKVVNKVPLKFQPTSVALSVDETQLAVGGADQLIHLFSISGEKLTETGQLKAHRGTIKTLAYNPDGKHLAAGDSNREILVWDVTKSAVAVEGWIFHTAAVNSVAWTKDGLHLASASLDGFVYVWSMQKKDKRIAIKDAHRGGANVCVWVDDHTLASAGNDCAVKTWTINFH